MATMVKEKPRAKKKTMNKHVAKPEVIIEEPPLVESIIAKDEPSTSTNTQVGVVEDSSSIVSYAQADTNSAKAEVTQNETLLEAEQNRIASNPVVCQKSEIENQRVSLVENASTSQCEFSDHAYKDACRRLDIVTFRDIPTSSDVPIEELERNLEASKVYLNQTTGCEDTTKTEAASIHVEKVENAMPSAPIFEEAVVIEAPVETPRELQDIKPKVQCLPLEVAMQVCGGKEMAEIRVMSEREEAIVETGSLAGPEHPLVDLLSTFRCSIILLEQDRQKVMQGYTAEENSRTALWKIEEREVYEVGQCPCGKTVSCKRKYNFAELMKSKLPAAQLRLDGLLKDVQESYCQHQHSTLLAYYQIEEFISETVRSSKGEIRAAAALVLHELRVSDTAPAGACGALCGALRRWARVLCAALLDARDPRHMLFVLHHLFRQTRSVRWAAPLLRVPLADGGDAARALALLGLLLAGPALEAARECTEGTEEIWEEVDKHGGGGAVSEGALRERDLLALLRAFPLRALVARLVLLSRTDITETRPYEWQYSAREVMRAACGVRVLLGTLRRAAAAHAHYPRLRAALQALAHRALLALAALDAHNRDTYSKDIEPQIEVELVELFSLGWGIAAPDGAPPPATLLRAAPRLAYCVALMAGAHEKSVLYIKEISLELPPFPCDQNVRVVAQAAIECDDHELARIVLDFLVQTALKRKVTSCVGACDSAAKECLPRLLRAHEYLYATALHMIAELHQVEPLQPSAATLKCFLLQRWRPATGEVRAVLEDWAQRCPQLLQYLLHELSYTPYDGLSLEAQLTVGSWLCTQPAPAPDWAWTTLTRLRVHRSSWRLPLDAPPPDDTSGVFAEAYAVLSSSWGHSVPVICEHGVRALLRVAAARAPVAAHALPLVMAAMLPSPESVSLTPQFAELVTSLLAPAQSLVQWARGERSAASALLLRRMLAQIEAQPAATRDATVSAWLHALRHEGLGGAPLSACDAALLAARRPRTLQEPPKPELLSHLVRNAAHAPLACCEALHATHAHRDHNTQLFPRLLHALHAQRAKAQRIHVDNALKQIGSTLGSEQLVVYQAAAAALAAAPAQPAHAALWTLLMHLYLHTHNNLQDTPPIGPLFFAGIIKSRTLAQLKKRLQETILYHHNQADSFKDSLRPTPHPRPAMTRETKSVSPEGDFIPAMSIVESAGGSSESDCEADNGKESEQDDESVSEGEEKRRVNVNMYKYHESAEKMFREFLCWLEAGDRLRASPHHADITRFIPEAALTTAWAECLNAMRPPPSVEDDDLRPPKQNATPEDPRTPLQTAVKSILKIRDKSGRRSQVPVITSPVDDVNFANQRQLYSLVDKHLAYIEEFARQWSAEVKRVSTLDGKLWQLVAALRVRVPLSPSVRSCSNRCKPIRLPLQEQYEWRTSEGAASAIKDNRSSARAAIRQFCKARPQMARTVAALNIIVRRVRSVEAAVGVAQRAWGCAGAAPPCALAHHALTALVEELADKWICSDGVAASSLVSQWCWAGATAAQQALCGALVSRAAAGAPRAHRPRLYTGLLAALGTAQPQRAFSYLSKFDMSRCVEESQRGEMLEALSQAAQSWGPEPGPELQMLVELIGVHTAALSTGAHLPRVLLRCARAAAAARLPPAHLAHVTRAAAAAHTLPFDQLGNLLRELGVIWWEARSELGAPCARFVPYAAHVAALQLALLRAFVAAGCALSYAPERVSWYAWAALQESWGAWVCPHPARPPLLPSAAGEPHYTTMLRHFVHNIQQMMLDCPGCEEQLLSQVWEWAVQTYLNVTRAPAAHDSRGQLADLLAELGALPWREHQCWRASCLPAALQISTTADVEMQTWVADTLQGVQAATWLRHVADCDVAPQLAALLQLFVGPLPLKAETLEQAALLPWHRLPEVALDQALERFFVEHHNPLQPYHDAPQFRVILASSGLCPVEARARNKHACALSQWTRAASAPPLRAHVAAHARALLALVAALEPHLEESSDELEELLSRAAVIMCMEHAAAAALPVWEQWVRVAGARCAGACVSAARALTAPEHFAPLADAAVAAYINANGSWSEAARRLAGGACGDAAPLLLRGRLHAAYALALATPTSILPLLTATINFSDKEVIAAVWLCVVCRAAGAGGAAGVVGAEGAEAARAALARWAEPPRLALLRALTGAAAPTHKHRLLCRLALCIITPNSEPLIRAYETAYPGVLGSHPDALAWARTPSPKHMPMLAVKLFPGAENYFTEELKMAAAL